MTAQQIQGVLPNFLIAGMMKSGTSALASYLGQHPDVWMPQRELHFFNRDRLYAGGVDAYRAHFHGWTGQRAVGEKTPIYGFHPQAAERMARMLPDVKLIWILPRTPPHCTRLFPLLVCHQPRLGTVLVSGRIGGGARRLASPQPNFSLANRAHRTLGHYAQQLKPFRELIPPARPLVSALCGFCAAPEATLVRICNFLEIDPTYPFDTFEHSVNVTYRPYSTRLQWLVTLAVWRTSLGRRGSIIAS